MSDEYWRDWNAALDETEKTGSIIPQVKFINKWKRINSIKAAQHRLHLTAFGVGVLALFAGGIVFLYKSLCKNGGK
jgi:hypothetical protein